MSLERGTRLGPYEVLSLVGAGGMGEVYRARDPRLGRDVAIKVLPEAVATDRDRLRRFEQEARATGQINHPHIVAVHDVGLHGSSPYLVCELLEGETLRERLRRGALSPRSTIDIGAQMGRGLAAAHAKGVVHRDLKPENLFLTTDGHLKILDFGIAKLKGDSAPEDLTSGRAEDTKPGLVFGTVSYMSPEQVRGETVDHRSDLFAAGSILYEMLTGRRAFLADTARETMTAILREEPPRLDAVVREVPRTLDAVIARCLAKQPSVRFQSAQDLSFALELVANVSERSDVRRVARPAAAVFPWRPVLIVLALLAAAAIGALIARAIAPVSPSSPIV